MARAAFFRIMGLATVVAASQLRTSDQAEGSRQLAGCGTTTTYQGVDFFGGDMTATDASCKHRHKGWCSMAATTPAQCSAACCSMAKCAVWTLSNGRCYFKKASGWTHVAKPGVVTGALPARIPAGRLPSPSPSHPAVPSATSSHTPSPTRSPAPSPPPCGSAAANALCGASWPPAYVNFGTYCTCSATPVGQRGWPAWADCAAIKHDTNFRDPHPDMSQPGWFMPRPTTQQDAAGCVCWGNGPSGSSFQFDPATVLPCDTGAWATTP